jgi:hypothetical protein
VTAALSEEPERRTVRLPVHGAARDVADPFAEVEV